MVFELPECCAYQVHHGLRPCAGWFKGGLVFRVPDEVLTQRILMKAYLQSQKRPAYNPVGNTALAQHGPECAANGTIGP